MVKRCTRCKALRPVAEFGKDASRSDGLDVTCRSCRAQKAKEHPRPSGYSAAYYAANRERFKGYEKTYRAKDPDGFRKRARIRRQRYMLKKNGWPADVYERLLADQNGLCAMCSQPPAEDKFLALDHDHGTGTIRGLLCTACNLVLGNAKDDPTILRAAIRYLAKWAA